jgi:hypothetical protein
LDMDGDREGQMLFGSINTGLCVISHALL